VKDGNFSLLSCSSRPLGFSQILLFSVFPKVGPVFNQGLFFMWKSQCFLMYLQLGKYTAHSPTTFNTPSFVKHIIKESDRLMVKDTIFST
jgi:hypothetical protein